MQSSRQVDADGHPVFPSGSNIQAFSPDDLDRIQEIFDDCMGACSFEADSEAAEALASAIIRLYSQGQHDPITIKAELLPSFMRRP